MKPTPFSSLHKHFTLFHMINVICFASLVNGEAKCIRDDQTGIECMCHEFTSWPEVITAVNNTNLRNPASAAFQPAVPILLTATLGLAFFANSRSGSFMVFSGIKGLNVYPWPLIGPNNNQKRLILSHSTIDFYVNDSLPNECQQNLLPDFNRFESKFVSIFSTLFQSMELAYGNRFDSPVCPYVFRNAALTNLDIKGQVATFLYTSLFRFENNALNDSLKTLNSHIGQVILQGHNYVVDTGLLHPLVFKITSSIWFEGTVASIQTDLFVHLSRVREITFKLTNVGKFYHLVGIDWMSYLPNSVKMSMEATVSAYSYPDKDFCLFASFPQDRSIHMYPNQVLNCTSVLRWLGRGYSSHADSTFKSQYEPCFDPTLYTGPNDTQIDKMVYLCKTTMNASGSSEISAYPDYYEVIPTSILLIQLVPFIFIPCACFLGLFLNFKIIQTIKSKFLKEPHVLETAVSKIQCCRIHDFSREFTLFHKIFFFTGLTGKQS
jgi:hypothetical protein